MCTLGFGADTDAWLMAQTAQKLRLGLGYDPARSLGNPLYEWLLAIIQPNLSWIWSNLLNVLIFCILMYRLKAYFNIHSRQKHALACLALLCLPFFLRAASSSMEYVLALLFLMEAHLATKKQEVGWAFVFSLLAAACRVEFLFFLGVGHLSFWRKHPFFSLVLGLCLCGYVAWAWGRNPSPIHDTSSAFRFYLVRLAVLFQGAGLMILALPAMIWFWLKTRTQFLGFSLSAANLLFFCVFPFEWEYLLPWFAITAVSFAMHFSSWQVWLVCLILPVAFQMKFDKKGIEEGQLKLKWEWIWDSRTEILRQYKWGQQIDFAQNTVFLNGATWLPTDVSRWTKVLDNRMFHRNGSHMFVAENLSRLEQDSLRQRGYVIKPNFED